MIPYLRAMPIVRSLSTMLSIVSIRLIFLNNLPLRIRLETASLLASLPLTSPSSLDVSLRAVPSSVVIITESRSLAAAFLERPSLRL